MKRLLPALLILSLMGCELIVDVEVPFEGKQVTVNSLFNPDSLWSAQLNLNRGVLDQGPFEEINDAQVIIWEGDKAIDTLTRIGGYGHFRSEDEKPEAGKTYTLSVSTPGYGELRATSSTPFPCPVTHAEAYEPGANGNTMIKVTLHDDGDASNYYELYADLENEYYNYDKGQMEYRRGRIPLSPKDPSIPDDDDRPSNSILFSDMRFNGSETELTFETSGANLSYHNTIIVMLVTLSEDAYDYLRTGRLQNETSGDPFAQPVNVHNNIQNGFGIFAGYSINVYAISQPKPVITSIEPMTGKAGDHIVITGENFVWPGGGYAGVLFRGLQNGVSAQIVESTATRIEAIVPEMAVTGKIIVLGGGIAVSDSDFIVIN
jgi:hypothetical protein